MIRSATPEDRDEVARMRQALWPDSVATEVEALLLPAPVDPLAVLVFERPDGTLGGFAEVATRPFAEGCTSSPVAYLEGIWVDPDVRRQGVARALVQAAESWALRQGLEELASDTGLSNRVSQAFHQDCGFEETERIVGYRKTLRRRPDQPLPPGG